MFWSRIPETVFVFFFKVVKCQEKCHFGKFCWKTMLGYSTFWGFQVPTRNPRIPSALQYVVVSMWSCQGIVFT